MYAKERIEMNRRSYLPQVKIVRLILFFLLFVQVFGHAWPKAQAQQVVAPSAENSAATPTKSLPKQPWQIRREKYWATVKNANLQDADATKEMNAVLTEFETQAFLRTPLENMDILGSFYIPREGVDKAFIVVVANATLGWYDALRFGSESGREEILTNEKFFLRAFTISDPKTKDQFVKFIKEHPDQVQAAVLSGFEIAEKYKKNPSYDVHWPTAYGLERMICALGGSCEKPKEMPVEQWDKAWVDAKQKVMAYYLVSNSPTK
jgi:hypothetical protein